MSAREEYVAAATPLGRMYVVPGNFAAISILPADDSGAIRLGLLHHLPEGAELQIEGPGYNPRTVRVKYGSASYYVFLDDLELVRKQAAVAFA
jgi:hypothetical protein